MWKKEAVDPNTEVLLTAVRNVNPVAALQCERVMVPSTKTPVPSSTEDAAATAMRAVRPAQTAEEQRYLVHLLVAHHEHCQYQGASCDGHCSFFSQVFSKGIHFWNIRLSLFDCVAIGHFLSAHFCFDSSAFDIANSGCGTAGLRSIAAGLSHCKSVRRLDLRTNACDDGSVLSSIIPSLSGNVERFYVDGNPVGSDGVVSVCKALSSYSNLS